MDAVEVGVCIVTAVIDRIAGYQRTQGVVGVVPAGNLVVSLVDGSVEEGVLVGLEFLDIHGRILRYDNVSGRVGSIVRMMDFEGENIRRRVEGRGRDVVVERMVDRERTVVVIIRNPVVVAGLGGIIGIALILSIAV